MPRAVKAERFADIEKEWEGRLPECFTNTVFVGPLWQRTWWSNFKGDSELRLLSVRDGGSLLGFAPLMLTDGTVGLVGSSDLCDYNDFIVPRGGENVFYSALFEHVAAWPWHTIDLASVPQDSPTLRHLPALAEKSGYSVVVEKEDVTPIAFLPSTWEEYVGGLSKKGRHELRRKLRRLEGAGVSRQYVCETGDTLAQGMGDFFRLLRASRPDKRKFMTPEREAFFTEMASVLGARGQFKLAFLELDGVRVASCIYFEYLDSYLLYNSGYDPRYANLSVGLLNKAMALKSAIEAGKGYFDFLRGDERYKYDLGAQDRLVYRMIIRR